METTIKNQEFKLALQSVVKHLATSISNIQEVLDKDEPDILPILIGSNMCQMSLNNIVKFLCEPDKYEICKIDGEYLIIPKH